jgi:two-component system NtrC family sensor kinase
LALPINWKILLIEDEEDIRDIMSLTLTDAGYSVICAQDGHTGIMLATREEPQIIITDIKMPGKSGLDVH